MWGKEINRSTCVIRSLSRESELSLIRLPNLIRLENRITWCDQIGEQNHLVWSDQRQNHLVWSDQRQNHLMWSDQRQNHLAWSNWITYRDQIKEKQAMWYCLNLKRFIVYMYMCIVYIRTCTCTCILYIYNVYIYVRTCTCIYMHKI